MRIKVKDKKRLEKNYWLNCDPYCYWISEEYEVKKGKTAGTIAERNVSGYTATFEQAVNSFIEKGIKAAEIELPCAVGDTVYWISESDACLFCNSPCYERCEEGALKIKEIPFKLHMLNEIGEIIFPTKEAAEAKLAEMEGAE